MRSPKGFFQDCEKASMSSSRMGLDRPPHIIFNRGPLETMPTWMRIGALINPTTYVVTGLRYLLLKNGTEIAGVDAIPLWLCFVAIVVFIFLGMRLALSAFRKSLK